MKSLCNQWVLTLGESCQNQYSKKDFGVAHKVSYLLESLASLSASHFPLLSQYEWHLLLNATKPFDAKESSHLIMESVRPDYSDFLLSKVAKECDLENLEDLENSNIASLTQAQNLSVMLASDRFWISGTDRKCDLRAILSEISQRPQECVFVDDPSPKDLWNVKNVSAIDQNTVQVDYDYNGSPMASMKFTVSNSRCEVYRAEFVCTETRPLMLPGVDLESFLFKKSLKQVFAAIDETRQGAA